MEMELDPLLSYRLRSVRIGLILTGLTIVSLIGFWLLPGHGTLRGDAFFALVGTAIGGALVIGLLPWERILRSPHGLWVMYAWSTLDIALISAVVALNGGQGSPLFLTFAFTTIFFATSYPIRAQVGLLLLSCGGYLAAVFANPGPLQPAIVVFRCSALIILAMLCAVVSRELMRQTLGHHAARLESERWARLLEAVARAGRAMASTDPDVVLDAVVVAAAALGTDGVGVGQFDDNGLYRMRRANGILSELQGKAMDAGIGLAERIRATGQTAITEDYQNEPDPQPEISRLGIRTVVAAPIREEGATPTAALFVASLQPRRFSAQEVGAIELLAAQAGTALRIARKFDEERKAVERLSELDRLKSRFLSSVSHELRTPLTVIIGNGKTLMGQWTTMDEDLKVELLGRLNANADSLEGIITMLLDFSRLEQGQVKLTAGPFDLSSLLERITARLSPLFSDRSLNVEVPPHLITVADVDMIDRVIENLLSNAAKHTDPGTHIVLAAERAGDWVTITVSDDGPGISERDLARLGERFFRGGDQRAPRAKGTGLGLAFCRELLELHGSTLEIASRLDEGSSFSFSLPAAKAPAARIRRVKGGLPTRA